MTARATPPIRLPFWATIFTALGMVVLCALGTWQVERLAWKNELIATMNAARAAEPAPVTADVIAEHMGREHPLVHGTLRGRYLHQLEFTLGPRPRGQKTGTHLAAPFLMEDGTTILVLRGWISDDADTFVQRPDDIVTITGFLREPTQTNAFTPKNQPARKMWFTLAPDEFGAANSVQNMAGLVFYEQTKRDDVGWPVPVDAWTMPNNNHLGYAIFWFAMAGVLGVMYVLRFVVYGRKDSDS